jgi:hypothetical protein
MTTNDDRRFLCPGCGAWRYQKGEPCPHCALGNAVPLRRLFADLAWDEASASVRLDYDQTQTADDTETTEDICRELRAAGLDPERMQRRVRELRERVAEERRAR